MGDEGRQGDGEGWGRGRGRGVLIVDGLLVVGVKIGELCISADHKKDGYYDQGNAASLSPKLLLSVSPRAVLLRIVVK